MAKHRPLTKFEQGYFCALANLISGHGCSTEAHDVFKASGVTLERIFAWNNLCEFDREQLEKLKSEYDEE